VSTPTTETVAEQASAPATLWRHGDFMRLWSGQTLSLIGSQVTLIAMPLVAVALLHATSAQMGYLTALARLPYIGTLFVGVWLDRIRRRPLLITTDAVRALLLASIPVLFLTHSLRLDWLYLVVFCVGLFEVVFEIANLAYLPSLVDRGLLTDANSKLQMTSSAAQIAGQGLAAILLAALSAAAVILADSVSFVFSAIASALIRHREEPPGRSHRASIGVFASIKEGVAFVWSNPLMRPTLLSTAFLMFFWTGIQTLYYPFAYDQLGVPASAIALILASGGPAAIVGAWLAPRLMRSWGTGRMLIWAAVFGNGSFILIPLAAKPLGLAVPMLIAAQLFFGIGMPLGVVGTMTLRQMLTPDDMQARVGATFRAAGLGISPLGALFAGLLAEAIGVHTAITVCAIGTLVPIGLTIFTPLRSVRDVPSLAVPEPAVPEEA
jgi:MFS family permease